MRWKREYTSELIPGDSCGGRTRGDSSKCLVLLKGELIASPARSSQGKCFTNACWPSGPKLRGLPSHRAVAAGNLWPVDPFYDNERDCLRIDVRHTKTSTPIPRVAVTLGWTGTFLLPLAQPDSPCTHRLWARSG